MKEIYKILHKPTGLFITRSTYQNHHSNLSKIGKIYEGNAGWNSWKDGGIVSIGAHSSLYNKLSEQYPECIVKDRYGKEKSWHMDSKSSDFEKFIIKQ